MYHLPIQSTINKQTKPIKQINTTTRTTEYNDNPLYSLGKQKKSSTTKSGIVGGGGGAGIEMTQHHSDEHHQYHHPQQQRVSISASNFKASDIYHVSAMEIFAAKRSEKKRNKSLKKKTQNTVSSTGCIATSTGGNNNGLLDSSTTAGGTTECSRKHHKHKKRKKHKKHHHRKNLIEVSISSEVTAQNSCYTATFISKYEESRVNQSSQPDTREEDEQEEEETEDFAEEQHTLTEDAQMHEVPAIKVESAPAIPPTVKVKTEHMEMDQEDESTSNLMSEISDEVIFVNVINLKNKRKRQIKSKFLNFNKRFRSYRLKAMTRWNIITRKAVKLQLFYPTVNYGVG